MEGIEDLLDQLSGSDNKAAYSALKILQAESIQSDMVYQFFDQLASMITSNNSYIRTRGLLLIAANARWDSEDKIDGILDEYLTHIMDEKPITARQIIQILPEITTYKPALTERIREALMNADPSVYPETMEPLVRKDIAQALKGMG
jgi:hypothetical protein